MNCSPNIRNTRPLLKSSDKEDVVIIQQTESSDYQIYPLHAFQRLTESQIKEIQEVSDQENEENKEERVLLCRNCGKTITSYENVMEIEGHHIHTFSNPYGIVFEIGCFSAAEGCINRGTPTGEFTWFKGFSWRYSLCSRCHIHLGWHYQTSGETFYGLILGNLMDGER